MLVTPNTILIPLVSSAYGIIFQELSLPKVKPYNDIYIRNDNNTLIHKNMLVSFPLLQNAKYVFQTKKAERAFNMFVHMKRIAVGEKITAVDHRNLNVKSRNLSKKGAHSFSYRCENLCFLHVCCFYVKVVFLPLLKNCRALIASSSCKTRCVKSVRRYGNCCHQGMTR